jgi:glyoxylase-like metal-dependent hydrolase (beta-lactamase superfamily II)
MQKVWTRNRAGTPASLICSSVPERPCVHQIVLPLSGAAIMRKTPRTPKSASPSAVATQSDIRYVQVYLIDCEPLTLVDTGVRSPESRARLEAGLEELGHSLADIQRVIVTHAHGDHMGLVQSIRDAGADLECLVHEADVPVVEAFVEDVRRRVTEMTSLFREYGVPEELLQQMHTDRIAALAIDEAEAESTVVDRILRDGDAIDWKDFALKVRHSPGHTPGHILLEDEEHGLLFTGDQVMGQAIPYAENFYQGELPEPDDLLRRRPRFRGLVELRRSLRALRGQSHKVLLPGYGGVIRRPDRAIRDTLLHYEVRLQRIDRGLRHLAAMGQEVTAFEIWKALFPANEPLQEIRSQMLLLIGALDCLEEDGKLLTERRTDGVLTHHHT